MKAGAARATDGTGVNGGIALTLEEHGILETRKMCLNNSIFKTNQLISSVPSYGHDHIFNIDRVPLRR